MRIIARMNIGGPAVQVTGLMRYLDNKTFDQILISGYVEENEADFLEVNNVDIPVVRIKGFGRSIGIWKDFNAFVRLVKVMREFRPDIVHTHTAKAGVLGRIAWIFLGYKPKIVHTYHGHLLHGYFGKIKVKMLIIIEKILGIATNRLLVVGNKVSSDLIKAKIAPAKKFLYMPPGLEISNIPVREEMCAKYGLNPNLRYCTFFGRVTKIKNPQLFLMVAEIFKNLESDLNFLLIGDGELLNDCKLLIKERNLPVIPLGWVTNVEDVLSISDLMLLTSQNEGMPLSLIQAGMAGIPVIATNVGSVSEVVLDDETGYLRDQNASNLAKAVNMLALDREKYREFSFAASRHCKSNFSVMRLVEDHEKLYKAL